MTEQKMSDIEKLYAIIQVQAKLLSNMQSYLATQRKLIETVLHNGATVMQGYEAYVAKMKTMYAEMTANKDGESDDNTASDEPSVGSD